MPTPTFTSYSARFADPSQRIHLFGWDHKRREKLSFLALPAIAAANLGHRRQQWLPVTFEWMETSPEYGLDHPLPSPMALIAHLMPSTWLVIKASKAKFFGIGIPGGPPTLTAAIGYDRAGNPSLRGKPLEMFITTEDFGPVGADALPSTGLSKMARRARARKEAARANSGQA